MAASAALAAFRRPRRRAGQPDRRGRHQPASRASPTAPSAAPPAPPNGCARRTAGLPAALPSPSLPDAGATAAGAIGTVTSAANTPLRPAAGPGPAGGFGGRFGRCFGGRFGRCRRRTRRPAGAGRCRGAARFARGPGSGRAGRGGGTPAAVSVPARPRAMARTPAVRPRLRPRRRRTRLPRSLTARRVLRRAVLCRHCRRRAREAGTPSRQDRRMDELPASSSARARPRSLWRCRSPTGTA